MTLESLKPVIGPGLAEVDQVLRAALDSEILLVRQIADYIIGGGGKRLRPALLLLAAGACEYRGRDQYTLAAVVEMIHTATLLHDDVVDESSQRRGRATANAAFGNAAAVLVGDFLYSRAFQLMVSIGRMPVLAIVADATNVIAEGEVMQLMNCHNPDIEEGGYLEVIRCKTAKLFEAATRLGAILSAAPCREEDAIADYGRHLGTAFQLIDDVLDYSGDPAAIGKNVGDDLAEGKPTLPLIYAIKHGSRTQADLVRRAIEHGGRDELGAVVEAIRSTGALDYARGQARLESAAGCDALARLPHSTEREYLLQLANFAVTRSY
jgi:octaprenyl-diphosphate synthase